MDWFAILLPALGSSLLSATLVGLGVVNNIRMQLSRYEERFKHMEHADKENQRRIAQIEAALHGASHSGGGLCDRMARMETTLTALVTSTEALRQSIDRHCETERAR